MPTKAERIAATARAKARVIEAHYDEFLGYQREEFAGIGIEPEPTESEKALERLQKLIEKHPNLLDLAAKEGLLGQPEPVKRVAKRVRNAPAANIPQPGVADVNLPDDDDAELPPDNDLRPAGVQGDPWTG